MSPNSRVRQNRPSTFWLKLLKSAHQVLKHLTHISHLRALAGGLGLNVPQRIPIIDIVQNRACLFSIATMDGVLSPMAPILILRIPGSSLKCAALIAGHRDSVDHSILPQDPHPETFTSGDILQRWNLQSNGKGPLLMIHLQPGRMSYNSHLDP